MYAAARTGAESETALAAFRRTKDELFRHHPDSPVPPDRRGAFGGLRYAPPDPGLRFEGQLDTDVESQRFVVAGGALRASTFTRIGTVRLPIGDLDVFWLEDYAGGLFLPFRDATSGRSTYEGGRYLLDTAKGADLGSSGNTLVIDFNYAYHPSCFYDARWACPLAPTANSLATEIHAGELA